MIPPFRFQHTELCLLSAATEAELLRDVSSVLDYLEYTRDVLLQDVANTLAIAWQNKRHRLAVVAESNDDLRQKLAAAAKKIQAGTARIQDRDGTYYRRAAGPPGKVMLLFPGESSAHPEMTRDLCLAHSFCREPFDDADQACRGVRAPFPLAAWIFPSAASPRTSAHLQGLAASVLASHAANTLFARFFERLDIAADGAGGFSSGEIAAIEHAGALGYLPRVQRVNLLHELAETLQDIEALGLSRAAPHTPAFEPAAGPVRRLVGRWLLEPPKIPLYSLADAAPFPADLHGVRDAAARQWTAPVLLGQTLDRMHGDGFRVFVELGARGDLTPLVAARLKGRPHLAVAVNRVHRADIPQLHHALALLAVNGVNLQPAALHHDRDSRVLRLDAAAPFTAPGAPTTLRNALSNLGALRAPAGWFSAGAESPRDGMADGAPPDAPQPPAQEAQAFLQNATVQTDPAAGTLTATVALSLDQLPFLRDESFGVTRVSAVNETLRGYTVLNLAFALEIMAEAASRLAPGKTLFQALNLRALQWIGFDQNEIALGVNVAPADYPDRRFAAFDVRLHAL
ncbi:MAG: hypothetical protein FWF96_08375, partial [Kiritimatiellaeota bacterium]|nr:hypothetical protein [Kiritimatiellota bacterium]